MKKPFVPRATSIVVAAVAVFLSSCNSTARRGARTNVVPARFTPVDSPTVDPSLSRHPEFEYWLGPGDVLDIEVLGDVNTRATTIVGPDGKIYFYLLPGIDVWGLTLSATRERIVQEMQTLIREQQPVSLTLRKSESQRIWLLGRLNKPGIFTMGAPITLLEALSEAGGPATGGASASTQRPSGISSPRDARGEAADLDRAFILREGRMLSVDFNRLLHEGDMTHNVYLRPNDFIYLPSAMSRNVHVLGAVERPRALDYVNQLTLLQAVSQAGGVLRPGAHVSQVAIVRGSLTRSRVAVVDMRPILAGQAPDIALEAKDIVFVPQTPYRELRHYVDLILDTYVRTVGVTEGARAVEGQAQPLGVTLPLERGEMPGAARRR